VPIVVGTLALLWAACYSLPRALALAGVVWLLLHFLL